MHLFFDFDDTITERDSIAVLAEAVLTRQRACHGRDLQAVWDGVVTRYTAEFNALASEHIPTEDMAVSLEHSRKVEEASLDRVGDSGIFAGLTDQVLHGMGVESAEKGQVVVREGFEAILALARRHGWPVAIVSANWSEAFIRGVLHRCGGLRIMTNHFTADGRIRGPGCLDGRRIAGSRDKLRALREAIGPASDRPVVYFGDSTADWDCLQHDRGVVIAADAQAGLVARLRSLDIGVPHIGELPVGGGKSVCWARDFREVLDSGFLERVAETAASHASPQPGEQEKEESTAS